MLLVPAVIVGSAVALAGAEILPLERRHDLRPAVGRRAQVPITAANYGVLLDVDITVGGQKFKMLADTGSADVWVVADGFQCISGLDNSVLPQSACNWAQTYHTTSTFKKTPDQVFGVQYGVGIAVGLVGTEKVVFAGKTIPAQTLGIVDRVTAPGSGIDSGILGLGYPILTSAHPGDAIEDNTTLLFDRINYNPILYSLAAQGSFPKWFSFAIERLKPKQKVGPGGYLALGELPPVKHSKKFAVAPVEITEAIPPILTNNTLMISEWTLTVPTIYWGPKNNRTKFSNTTAFQVIVDTGNMFHQFPEEIVDGILSQFDPLPVPDFDNGVYRVACNAKVPKLGITIGGTTFWHLDQDLILYNFLGDGGCVAAFRPSATGMGVSLSFIGDPLMKNVISVFDFGKDEMRFSARKDGGGTGTSRNSEDDDDDDEDDDDDDEDRDD